MSNIVLAGLKHDSNLGDQVILLCVKHMLSDSFRELHITDVEIREMDLAGRVSIDYTPACAGRLILLMLKVIRKAADILHLKEFARLMRSHECRQGMEMQCKQICDENTNAIIFAGGGIIKFKGQDFSDQIDVITKFADDYKIPVMFSAVGIEGYDGANASCRKLQAALNRSCVRVITTRDDFRLLNDTYCKGNMNVRTALVADAACSLSRYFPSNQFKEKRIIGLGVAREGLFLDYGIKFNKESMLTFWESLIHEIEKRGYMWKLFSNGASSDQLFAEELLQHMGIQEELKHVLLAERPTSTQALAGIINRFSGVIVCRLHASIIAYSYGIPAVGLVWNEKQVMFGKAIGCEEHFFRVDRFEPGAIVETLLSAMEKGYDEKARAEYCRTTEAEIRGFLKGVYDSAVMV